MDYQHTYDRLRAGCFRVEKGLEPLSDDLILDVFRFQGVYNPVYREYLDILRISPEEITTVSQIPYLPISVFKSHKVITGKWEAEVCFESSGTSGQIRSRHYIRDIDRYLKGSITTFESLFGALSNTVVLGLLPSYIERPGASLIHMVRAFMARAADGEFITATEIEGAIHRRLDESKRLILFGVSFALIDLPDLILPEGSMVFETGGMKGRGKELIREELHEILCTKFGLDMVYSEYGMTELCSQAYTAGEALFQCASGMRVTVGELNDPFQWVDGSTVGRLHIIDVANLDTCSFIATEDLGRCYADGRFEVLGRADGSEQRGCNLLYTGD